jgi:hypothetical protein
MTTNKNYKILDQWQEGECAIYALVAALMRMKDWVDGEAIIEEARPFFNQMISHKMAARWLMRRGYIKDIVPFRYNPLLLPQIPLIARLYSVDWVSTRKNPYRLTRGAKKGNAHYVCITDKGTCVNSWWEKFWDKWYFYFTEEELPMMSFISRLII